MEKRKVPARQCVGCNEMKNKKDLIRVIKTPEDTILLDLTGKKNGRGAYICHSVTCFEKAKRSKALEKSLRISIPFDVYDELEKELSESEGR
mgnify:CR=1 FL=1